MKDLEETKSIFEERKEEVKQFFDFLDLLINKKPKLYIEDEPLEIDITLTHIMKAQGYLLLYNLVESTVANSISSIHHFFHDKQVEFSSLPENLQKKLLQQFCNEGASSIFPINQMSSISQEIIKRSYNKKSLFSGNIDGKLVKKLSEDYGFNIDNTDYKHTGHGKFIRTVKDNRNALAHGNKSFTDCGRETVADDLLKAFKQIPNYLEELIKRIEVMLENYSVDIVETT